MEKEKISLINTSPWAWTLDRVIRALKINIWGRVMHNLIWGETELSKFFQDFLHGINIKPVIDKESEKLLDFFRTQKSWIIIQNHQFRHFWDYIILLSQLTEQQLQNTTFFAGKATVEMFRRTFWNKYNFQIASFDNFSDAREWYEAMQWAVEKVNSGNWFIFIIPGGSESEDSKIHEAFLWMFTRMVNQTNKDTLVLSAKNEYPESLTYWDMYRRAWNGRMRADGFPEEHQEKALEPKLQVQISTVWYYNDENPRDKYENIFQREEILVERNEDERWIIPEIANELIWKIVRVRISSWIKIWKLEWFSKYWVRIMQLWSHGTVTGVPTKNNETWELMLWITDLS